MSTVYVTKAEFTRQKSRLTRAQNTGDPVAVLKAVETTLDEGAGKAWPDDWSRWLRALEDAFYKFARSDAYEDDAYDNGGKLIARFRAASDRF